METQIFWLWVHVHAAKKNKDTNDNMLFYTVSLLISPSPLQS
jgi:hypothetical protein